MKNLAKNFSSSLVETHLNWTESRVQFEKTNQPQSAYEGFPDIRLLIVYFLSRTSVCILSKSHS